MSRRALTMVAVDLGAQSGRVAVGRFDGARLELEIAHRFPNVPVRTRGRLQWDVLRLYGDVLDGLRVAGRETGRVDSVGVDSWAVDFGLLDRAGRLLANPVHYRDARREQAMAAALGVVPPRELYERTAIQLLPINTVFELAAMAAEGDPLLEIAETLLLIPDLVHYWLCGVAAAERTNASTTQCFDPFAGGWATDLLDRLGVSPRILPRLVDPATRLGPLTEETGLGAATVVAGATHDTAAAVAAVPFAAPGAAYISAGTWSLVGVEIGAPLVDDRSFSANLTNEGGVAGTVRLLRNVTGLWLLHECRRAWADEGYEVGFDALIAEAQTAPPLQALVDPDDPRFTRPGDMHARVREACLDTGQEPPADRAGIVRCLLESLALKHARTIDLLAEVTGTAPPMVHVVGGGAQNDLLCRWTAEAVGVPIVAGPAEATLVGNLVTQAMALGEIGSLEEGREVVRRSFTPTTYEPSGNADWPEARARFAALYTPTWAHEGVAA